MGLVVGLTLLDLAHGAVGAEECGILGNLDLHEINPAAFMSPGGHDHDEGLVAPPAMNSKNPGRGDVGMGLVMFSRRLSLFVLAGVRKAKEREAQPLEANPSAPKRPGSKPIDEPRVWGEWAQMGDSCHCPSQNAKSVEHTLIRYCGGFRGSTQICLESINIVLYSYYLVCPSGIFC